MRFADQKHGKSRTFWHHLKFWLNSVLPIYRTGKNRYHVFTTLVKTHDGSERQFVMNVEFKDEELELLLLSSLDGRYGIEVLKGYRKVVNLIMAASDERDFRNMRSLNYEKLKGDRNGEYSFRINRQWRLIVEFRGTPDGNVVVVKAIEDYH